MRIHKTIYAAVAALLLCLAFGAAPAAAQGRADGKIAFERIVNGATDIFVVDADGTGEKNLTETPFNESQPAWSPDGSRVVFASLRNAVNNVSTYDLYAADVDGGATERLTTNGLENVQPSWSAREAARATTASVGGRVLVNGSTGLAGVTVHLSGARQASAETDGQGRTRSRGCPRAATARPRSALSASRPARRRRASTCS